MNLSYPLNISDVFDEMAKRNNTNILKYSDIATDEFELIQTFRFKCEKQFNPIKDRSVGSDPRKVQGGEFGVFEFFRVAQGRRTFGFMNRDQFVY